MYQHWLADVVADAFRGVKGYRVEISPGWSTRGSSSYDPVGVMNHHTGSNGSFDAILEYMLRRATAIPPPLCNLATSRPEERVVRIVVGAAGRANHAGYGDLSWTETNNGNYRTIGIENENSGYQDWPEQQHEGIIVLTAALLKHMDRERSRAVDHKTYAPDRKWDRGSVDVDNFQRDVGLVLRHGIPKPKPVPPYEPPPASSLPKWQGKDDAMLLIRIKGNPHHGDQAVYSVVGGALMRVPAGAVKALVRDVGDKPMVVERDHPYVVTLPVFNPGTRKWQPAAGAPKPQPPTLPKPKPGFQFDSGAVLKRGDDGAAVKEWQQALLRWDKGSLPEFGADGDFGDETVKATKAFQRKAGIGVDGVVGENTRRAMEKALSD